MRDALNNVTEFHRRIGAWVASRPMLLPCEQDEAEKFALQLRGLLESCRSTGAAADTLICRLALELEELAEWVEAHAAGDLVAAADGWGDRLYVLLGDAVATGLPGDAIFDEVHRSNMTKATTNDRFGKATKDCTFQEPHISDLIV